MEEEEDDEEGEEEDDEDEDEGEAEGGGVWNAALRELRLSVGTRVLVDEGTAKGVRGYRVVPTWRSSRATALAAATE